MLELALHLIRPIVRHPDAVAINVIEGEDATILETVVHPDDLALFHDEDDRVLRAVRTILSAAAGRKQATLELVESAPDEA
jgi:predicted RNA-binding protein YlqC (UPF0109 family)